MISTPEAFIHSRINMRDWLFAYVHNRYIPQTDQHEPKEQMLFCLRNVTDDTP